MNRKRRRSDSCQRDEWRQVAPMPFVEAVEDERDQRQRLFANIAASMKGVPQGIVERQIALCDKVDPAYGASVREAVKR